MARNRDVNFAEIDEHAMKARTDKSSLEQLLESKQLLQRFAKIANKLCGVRRRVGLHEPEDIQQELCLRIIEKIHLFRGDARFTTWAERIAINIVLAEVSEIRGRHEVAIDNAWVSSEGPACPTDFSYSIESEQDARLIKAEIGKLPQELRKAVSQYFFEGMSFRQMAKVNGYRSAQTAANYVNRAVRKLRNTLEITFDDKEVRVTT